MSVGILGLGAALPSTVVRNDDPRFASGRAARHGEVSEDELFTGLAERRALDATESVEALTADAAQRALAAAGVSPQQVERLYGYASPSAHLSPNGLYRVHRLLGLPRAALVLPVQTEFTNFISSVALAREAVVAGGCDTALVACGAGWTRNMDYESPHALSIGDGAAAAVIGRSERLVIVDHAHETYSDDEDTMVLDLSARHGGPRQPTFALTDGGVRSFITNGVTVPPRMVLALLSRNGVSPSSVALITHQASRRLMDAWADAIRPAEYPSTLGELGNMTLATVGVTLAQHIDRIRAEYVVLVALGLGVHFSVLLLRR